jgi:hypothetical protein
VEVQYLYSHPPDDDDLLAFFRHLHEEGDLAALQWLRDKLGPTLPAQPSASERK